MQDMPPKNYKSITIPDDLYSDLKQKYETKKKYFFRRGIRSFSAYISYRLSLSLEEDE